MTVLITGAGLIGSQIANLFVRNGERTVLYDIAPIHSAIGEVVELSEVSIMKGDILDLKSLLRVMKEHDVDRVVHTAALLPGALARNLQRGIQVNLDGTLNVLEAARQIDAKRVVYTSTIGVYDKGTSKGSLDEDAPLRPVSLYGATKLMGEFMGTSYTGSYGLDFRSVRFANVFGPYSGPVYTNTGRFLNSMLEAAASGGRVKIDKIPPMVEDAEWIYSKDAAMGVYLLATSDRVKNVVFNIGTGETTTARELVSYIQEFVPSASVNLETRTNSRLAPMNIERAKRELGYSPRYNIREGVREMLDWYRSRGGRDGGVQSESVRD